MIKNICVGGVFIIITFFTMSIFKINIHKAQLHFTLSDAPNDFFSPLPPSPPTVYKRYDNGIPYEPYEYKSPPPTYKRYDTGSRPFAIPRTSRDIRNFRKYQ